MIRAGLLLLLQPRHFQGNRLRPAAAARWRATASTSAFSALGDPVVKKTADAHGVSTAQVTLKWSLQRGVAVVTGTDNKDHMASDLDLFGFALGDDDMAEGIRRFADLVG